MATIQQTYIYALLADATYADNLTDGDFGTTLEGRLSLRMTPTLAKFIGDNFEVVSHVESGDGVGSGFDATAWRGRVGTPYAGQLYISMQGTLGLADKKTRTKTLIIDSLDNLNLILSSRNVEKTKVTNSFGLNIYDIIYHEKLLISK